MAAAHEMAHETTADTGETRGRRGRRGMIASVAALAAGLLAKEALAPERVAAIPGTGPDGNLVMGSDGVAYATNIGFHKTLIEPGGGFRGNGLFEAFAGGLAPADVIANGIVDGLRGGGAGGGSGVAAYGGSNGGSGVFGVGGAQGTAGNAGVGVTGLANGATNVGPGGVFPAGVYGNGRGVGAIGVLAESDSGYGLYAKSDGNYPIAAFATSAIFSGVSSSGPKYGAYAYTTNAGLAATDLAYGMFGLSTGGVNHYGVYGTTDLGRGVYGNASGTGGTGVYGTSTTGVGVFGVSGGGGAPYGVVGSVSSAPGFGLVGSATVANTGGFAGAANVTGSIAGQFSGPVNIYTNGAIAPGTLYVQGTITSPGGYHSVTRGADGAARLVYGMNATEAWVEDFGEGTLTGGKADVKLDADFAAGVDTGTLHVFTESHDENHALHVAGKSATGFTVGAVPSTSGAAAGKKTSDLSGTFTYRLVAKRKDVQAERLAKFTAPQEIKTPALVIPPAPPASPPPMPSPPVSGGKKG